MAAILLTPAAAMAQGNPGPFGALFGRSEVRANQNVTFVDFRSDASGQYQNALLPPEGQRLDVQPGMAAGGLVSLNLEHVVDRFSANAAAAASHQQMFLEPNGYGVNRYNASLAVAYKVTTRLETNAGVSYGLSPDYGYMSGFGVPQSVLVDPYSTPFSPYAVAMLENQTFEGSVGVTERLGRRSTVTASAHGTQTKFTNQPGNDFQSTGLKAAYQQEISRGLGAHIGYGRDHIKPSDRPGAAYDNEVIDAGLDFNKALSLARRTTLSFTTSTSITKQTGYADQFRVNGGISFAKYFRRTWSATAQVARSTQYIPGFIQPVYSDSASASLGGMFSTRLNFSVSVGAGLGQYAFSGGQSFNGVSATSHLGYAISRHVQTYASYIAFFSEVPRGTTVLGLPASTRRQAVSVGVSAYVPVMHKVRAGQ